MKNLVRAAAILSGVVGLSGVAAALAVGCGGDDTVIGYGPDSGGDGPTIDSSSDTFVPGDSGPDTSPNFDAGKPDLSKFASQINQTGCAWLATCCGGPTAFDTTSCVHDFDDPATDGFLFTRPLLDTIDGGGNVTFDQSKASLCLSLIQGLPCGTQTTAQLTAIRDACYGALSGNIAANGTGCTSTIECAPPSHCESTGGGTCIAPYPQGESCVFNGDQQVDSLNRCGRAFAGTPGYCEVGDPSTVLEAGTCANPQADNASCAGPYECSSWVCDTTNGVCATSEVLITPDVCAAYIPDAG